MTITDYWFNFAIATLLPALVALVRARYAGSTVGALLLAGLSALTVVVQEMAGVLPGDWDWKVLLSRFFVTFVTAIALHYGFLKPVGVTGDEGVIERTTPGGIGADGGSARRDIRPL